MSEPPASGTPVPAPTAPASVADLAHLVADSADERQRAAASEQEVLLPEDLLPGVGEEAMSLREGLRSAGAKTFVILADHRRRSTTCRARGLPSWLPNIQSSYHVSTGAITFVAGISGGFLVLGHRPDGLAGRPIPACAHHRLGDVRLRHDGVRHGLATNIFLFFLARFGAGISQSSNNRQRLTAG